MSERVHDPILGGWCDICNEQADEDNPIVATLDDGRVCCESCYDYAANDEEAAGE